MKKYVLFMILVTVSNVLFAEGAKYGKFGIEYGYEMCSNGVSSTDYKDGMYVDDFNSHKLTLSYKQPVFGKFYIEPRVSFYMMKCDKNDFVICYSDSIPKFAWMKLWKVYDNGLSASMHIGYNIPLNDKMDIDLFIAPDYRYSLKCRNDDSNLYENDDYYGIPLYKRSHFLMRGGARFNYGAWSISCDYSKYLTNRFQINKNAALPAGVSISIGYRFGHKVD